LALPLTRPRVAPGLVASAASYTSRSSDNAYLNRKALTWQKRALAYLDLVPELAYSSRFYARMLRPLRVFPGTLRPDGTIEPIKEGLPVEMLGRLKGKDGTSKSILGSYGRLMFTTGEGNLLGLHLDTEDEYWSFVWNEEVDVERVGDRVTKVIHKPMGNADPIEYSAAEARVFRMWTPHPRRSGEADSPMRSVLEIAEELIALTASVRATATSRTVQGMLLMPTEMVPVPAEVTGDEDEESDPFVDEMLSHLESQVEDAGSAAAASPWVIWGAYELLDRIRMVQLHDPQTDYMERDLRKEAVERMARGMDFPAEYLMGLATANHWAAKQILDDMWRSHGTGIADQYVGDINDAYLRPGLREGNYPGWEDIVIGWDEAAIVVPADQSADADAAHDRGEISGSGYRKLKNIPEEYKPSADEHDEYLAIKLKNEGILGIEAPASAPNTPDTPLPPGPEGDSGRKTRVVAASVELGAAEMALARCRELAGIRIKQKEKICPEFFVGVNGGPNGELASVVGVEILDRLSTNALALVRGGADTLKIVLATWGYAPEQAEAISEMVESYAARTLFKNGHQTLPSGFAAQFDKAKEASHVND
jgi:hypothetical protein